MRQKITDKTAGKLPRARKRTSIIIASALCCLVLVVLLLRGRRVELQIVDSALFDRESQSTVAKFVETIIADRNLRLRSFRKPIVRLESGGFRSYMDTAALVAFDPYVLLVRSEVEQALDPEFSAGTTQSFFRALPPLSAPGQPALLLAGNQDAVLLAWFLALSRELLEPGKYQQVLAWLRETGDRPVDSVEIIVAYCKALTSQGVLAPDWTNWDSVSVNLALDRGLGAVAFVPRSMIKGFRQTKRMFYTVKRLPSGSGKRSYVLFGHGLSLLGDAAALNGTLETARSAILENGYQIEIERQTLFTPVRGDTPYENRDHRDVVAWIQNSATLESVDVSAWLQSELQWLRQALTNN